MADNIVIRELKSMAEISATVELQKAVWGMHDAEVSSPHTLRAIVHAGGSVIGAEDGGRLAGFCFGMAAWRWGELWLWSHMAGVRPEYQGRGLGFRLKQAQREWALAHGFRQIAWTFDPLQSGNANFNFNKLGVSARIYSPNHYGDMQDGINAGLASDRLEAQWQLEAPHVVELAEGRPRGAGAGLAEARPLVWVDAAGALQSDAGTAFGDAHFAIEIPRDIAALKQHDIERAKTWQLLVRRAMTALFDAGYAVTGFERSGGKAWYIVTRES
ncbi:MAG: GNAT family N-acetyltransferase [Chloroflexi bacterium]|nr:GNAT family N-acetyltransferase [Chloroflexota bacterium]